MTSDLLIIGGGPAGLAAAVYGRRRGLKVTIIEAKQLGGYLPSAPTIENYPGIPMVSGAELAKKMELQATSLGVETVESEVLTLKKNGQEFVAECADGSVASGKALLLATGTVHKTLGVKGEAEYAGKGVSYCATCDAPLFKGKQVAVIGGGNTALTSALVLADACAKVYVVHHGSEFTHADAALVERARKHANVKFVLDSVATEVRGGRFVKSVVVANVKTKKKRELRVDGVFVHVGVKPASELAAALGVEVDAAGFVKVDLKNCATSVPGVYAAGDVTGWFKQIVSAAAQGALAATSAADYLKSKQ